MTKKELITLLDRLNDSDYVFIRQTNDEFTYSLINSVQEEEIKMTENSDGSGLKCYQKVILISDN